MVMALISMPACISTAPDCSLEEVFCAGLVTDLHKISDKGFNQSAWEGLQQAKTDGLVTWIDYIESTDYRDYEKNITLFAKLGYDVILTVGDGPSNDTRIAALEFTEVYFIGVDQYQAWAIDADSTNDIPNLSGLVFPEDQAGFLAGALAAMVSATGKVGAVCAGDVYPHIWRFGEGYRAGAAYIEPTIEVQVVYHNDASDELSFHDPEWGAITAGGMIETGVDVVFGVGAETGEGAIDESAGKGVFVIGAETDKYLTQPIAAPRLLTSVMKLITPGLIDLLQAAKDARAEISAFPAGNYYGRVGAAPFHDLDTVVADEIKVRLEEIRLMLLNGELQTGVPASKP